MENLAEKTLSSSGTGEQTIAVAVAVRGTLLRDGVHLILASACDIDVVAMISPDSKSGRLLKVLQPDVVLVDTDLPEPESTVRNILTQAPDSKVLLLATNVGIQPLLALLQAGVRGCVTADATARDLVSAVRRVSRNEMVLDPEVARQIVDRVAPRSSLGDNVDSLQELLTDRERELLDLLCRGLTDKQIAQKLYISVRTVNSHLGHVYSKLGVHSRTEAMRLAVEKGWLSFSGNNPPPTGPILEG